VRFRSVSTSLDDVILRDPAIFSAKVRNQHGTPCGAKSFLTGAQIFFKMPNSFEVCPTHFSKRAKNFAEGEAPPLLHPGYWPVSAAESLALTVGAVIMNNAPIIENISFVIRSYCKVFVASLMLVEALIFLQQNVCKTPLL